MQIPAALREAIEKECEGVSLKALGNAAAALSDSYRATCAAVAGRSTFGPLAYAITRMPATYAAVRHVLGRLQEHAPELRVRSVLDLGAGTGAAWWAVRDVLGEGCKIRMIELDGRMAEMGRRLSPGAVIESGNFQSPPGSMQADLVLLSYSLGELPDKDGQLEVIGRAWDSASALAIVEPGTMQGFKNLVAARDLLLSKGATIAAPCPHSAVCPLQSLNDWCHFAVRVERTSLHRRLKGGALGHEDEKFCYLVAVKGPASPAQARITRHPSHEPGLVQFPVCSQSGRTESIRVTKKEERFRTARKAQWGDGWS